MCKNTDQQQPVGIPVPLPSILPPIEKWYVVARKPSSGTCSIYTSWADYRTESKLSRAKAGKTKAVDIEDTAAEVSELAAFPIMAQALTYIKALESDSRSSSPIPSNDTTKNQPSKANSHLSGAQLRLYKSAMKTIQVIDDDGDRRIESGEDTSPSPIPSENPLKKRKITDIASSQQTGDTSFARPKSMSQTSETINIGSRNPDTSSLDALAIAASAKPSQVPHVVGTSTSEDMESENTATAAPAATRGSLPIPQVPHTRPRDGIIAHLPLLPENAIGRLPGRLSPSLLADYNNARKTVEQQHQSIRHHRLHQQQQHREAQQKIRDAGGSLTSKVVIPEVPTTKMNTVHPSLQIPEVPRGFIPADLTTNDRLISRAISDHLKSSMDPRIGPALTIPSGLPPLGISNRLSLDSYPLGGNFPRQMPGLPRHLHASSSLPPSFRPPPPHAHNLFSLQHENALLINHRHLRNSAAYAQHIQQQHLQASIEISSTASVASDHSEITLPRHNGHTSRPSSPRL